MGQLLATLSVHAVRNGMAHRRHLSAQVVLLRTVHSRGPLACEDRWTEASGALCSYRMFVEHASKWLFPRALHSWGAEESLHDDTMPLILSQLERKLDKLQQEYVAEVVVTRSVSGVCGYQRVPKGARSAWNGIATGVGHLSGDRWVDALSSHLLLHNRYIQKSQLFSQYLVLTVLYRA